MQPQKLENNELGLSLNYWNGQKKNERVYLASQVLKQFGYTEGRKTLERLNLVEGIDRVTITRSQAPAFFDSVCGSLTLSKKTNKLVFLYESGVNKLMLMSETKIGKDLRNWLTREVLPSIYRTGTYTLPGINDIPQKEITSNLERPVQIQHSKDVNKKCFEDGGKWSIIEHNVKNCVLTTGLKPEMVKIVYPCKKSWSAKETLRHHRPELAAAMSFNDYVVVKYNVSIEDPRLKELVPAMTGAFNALIKMGFRITE